MTQPAGIDIDQYRTQAKRLLKLALSADPQAVERIRNNHPEHDFVASRGSIKLADTQLVIAREAGFGSWAKFREYLLFREGVDLLDAGKIEPLIALLRQHPATLTYRCYRGDYYEQGYFAGATLLNHVAGNPIRRPLPANILEVTRALLDLGADPNIATASGNTTIGLILTGKQVADAGVGVALLHLLKRAGAKDDIERDDVLSSPLWNGGRATTEELVRSGVKMALRHAAALGRVDALHALLSEQVDKTSLEVALIYACYQGEELSARILIQHGAKGDSLLEATDPGMPAYAAHATALHIAAWCGHQGIVRLLLGNGAHSTVVEPTYHGTALGWAEYAGNSHIADILRQDLTSHELPIRTFINDD